MDETEYLLKSPTNADRLLESVKSINGGFLPGDKVAFWNGYWVGSGSIESINNDILTLKLFDDKIYSGHTSLRCESYTCHYKQALRVKDITKNGIDTLIHPEDENEFLKKNPFRRGDIIAAYEDDTVFYGVVRWQLGSAPDILRVDTINESNESDDMLLHWRQCEKLKGKMRWKIKMLLKLKAMKKKILPKTSS